MVAAAIVGGAIIGGVGTSMASSKSSKATRSAAASAADVQREGLEQQKELSAPYRALGEAAIPKLEQLLGLDPNANADTIKAALEATPGYKFAADQGRTGVLNAASLGGGVGGNTLAELERFNQGLASGTYQQNIANLSGAVNTGQAAAAGQAANVGAASSNIGNILTNAGNTQAAISANTIAGITKALGGAADQYASYQTIDALNRQWGGDVSGYSRAADTGIGSSIGYPSGGP
jgi:hypothetical protein